MSSHPVIGSQRYMKIGHVSKRVAYSLSHSSDSSNGKGIALSAVAPAGKMMVRSGGEEMI